MDEIEDMEMESSPVSADEPAEAVKPAPAEADSSPATDEGDSDLLSVVRDAVRPAAEAESAATASSADGEEEEGEGEEPEKPPEQDNENYSDVPFNKHPRFRQLLTERNAFKADAQRYQNVQKFLDSNGLASEEAADGMVIMALAKTNPAEAWTRIKPWVQSLLVAAGEVLPPDLQQRVQQGQLDRQTAQEMSRMRAGQASMTAQQQLAERQRQAEALRGAQTAIMTTVTSWEQDRRARDPNFDAKMEPLQKEVAFLQLKEGKPRTAEAVREQLDRAYRAVNVQLRPAGAPSPVQKRPISPVRSGTVAGDAQPKPESTLDIIRANRRRA